MRKAILFFSLIALYGTALLSSILDFFPSSHDYFVLIDGTKTLYDGLRGLPFFELLFGEKGLGFEGTVNRTLAQRVSDPTPILLAFSKRILVAGKGRFALTDLLKFDIEHYINFPRNLNEKVLVVEFEGDFVKFLEEFSRFLGMPPQGKGDTFFFRDKKTSLYLKRFGRYLVMSGVDVNTLEFGMRRLEKALDEIELDEKGKVFGYFRELEFMGYSGEAFLKGEVKDLFFEIVLEHKVVCESQTTVGDNMAFLPFLGDLYVRVPKGDTKGFETFLLSWFAGNRGEVAKLRDIFNLVGARAQENVFVVGNLWDPPSLSVFFKGARLKELESDLVKYGAIRKREGEMELHLGETQFKIYEYRDFLIFSSLEKTVLTRTFERKVLGDHPSYQFFLRRFPSIGGGICMFVDLGRIVGKLVGLRVNASFFLLQYLGAGKITYRMGVM